MDNSIIDIKNFTGLAFDSRKVKPGNIFFAIKGEKLNGEEFINQAIAKGASTIVVSSQASIAQLDNVRLIKVDNPRQLLSRASAEFYNHQPENIVGVTGTSGKTSTVGFYRQIAEYAGLKSASIGTLGVVANDLEFENLDSMTTPDPVTLHQVLNDLYKEKITHVGMEVSSHGLEQYRLDGVSFKAGGFTNFTQDHLDYHKNMEEYFNAKMRFFRELLPSSASVVLNKDILQFPEIRNIARQAKLNIISYGTKESDINFSKQDNSLVLNVFGRNYQVPFILTAEFQQYNIACALGLAILSGVKEEQAVESISHLIPAVGRLQKIASFNGAEIYVDYAHKPDALEKVLKAARLFTNNKLHVLFGCGGDRDKEKRPLMGQIATNLADKIYVTDDNPRTEDPSIIRKEILAGCQGAMEIGGRRDAIRQVIYKLEKGDTLVIAGKGHEDYQIIGDVKYRFSDAEEVLKVVSEV